jgi:hypothetical protein
LYMADHQVEVNTHRKLQAGYAQGFPKSRPDCKLCN